MDDRVETERRESGALAVLPTLLAGAAWTVSLPLALLSGLGGGATAARRRSAPPQEGARASEPGESDSLAAMSLALRRLEAELYALDDQRLTDLAERDGGG